MLSTAYIAKFPRFLSILPPTSGKTFTHGGIAKFARTPVSAGSRGVWQVAV